MKSLWIGMIMKIMHNHLSSIFEITINFKEKKSNKFIIFHSLFRWRQWFPKKKKDDDTDVKRDALVGFYQMVSLFKWNIFWIIILICLKFRFADRIDFVLMFLSICFVIVGALSFTVNLTLAARLAGLFALESFGSKNSQHLPNSVDIIRNNLTCPLGINLNSDNFGHLHK
jgi:hypothetical protein